MKTETTRHCNIWLDNLQKIASFHLEEGFELMEFLDLSTLDKFSLALAGSGYRFQ